MSKHISRREVLRAISSAGAGAALGAGTLSAQETGLRVRGRAVEIAVAPVSAHTVRISLAPIENGRTQPIKSDGSLVELAATSQASRFTALTRGESVRCGELLVKLTPDPLTIRIEASDGRLVQQLRVDTQTGSVYFVLGNGPLLGLGEGGPQFDRRGSTDRMRSGQGGYRLRTHGGRVPIQWMIGTGGWAMFIHQPLGAFDFSGQEGRFDPVSPASALPLDIFVVAAREPARVMAEYARITGHPEMPPLWSLGYQQSHRTLANSEAVLSVARTFREKK